MNKQQYKALSSEFREKGLPHDHPLYDHFAEIDTVLYRQDDWPYDEIPQLRYTAASMKYAEHISFLYACWDYQEHERHLDYLDAWGWA